MEIKGMGFHSILVPVIGTEAADYAVGLACGLAKKHKALIYAVYVIPIERTLPLDIEIEDEIQKAENILNHIESVAGKQDYKIETELLQAREAAPAIVNEAVEREVDLILMGVEYKKRFGKFSLGDVVPYVLENSPCRVILYHQPITESEI